MRTLKKHFHAHLCLNYSADEIVAAVQCSILFLLFMQRPLFIVLDDVDTVLASVADPDPHVFGPPGSGSESESISQRYGFGSGSYH